MKKERVMFFCKHNSCRSQMAEGLLRHLAKDQFEVCSAGMTPEPIHPLVYKVMEEIGIDISSQRPKSVDMYLGREAFNHIFIVCQEGEAECPRLYPFAMHVERWPLPNPAAVTGTPEAVLNAFCATRDMLETKIKGWIDQMKIKNQSK